MRPQAVFGTESFVRNLNDSLKLLSQKTFLSQKPGGPHQIEPEACVESNVKFLDSPNPLALLQSSDHRARYQPPEESDCLDQ
ncbi:hypothetical protein CEXT_227821 [Caerostris extrusa]|uniref:Uncharacterized protein n=1 Tax=Caerostris extrusa TaxID=172846 RepID=A0AAV4X0Y1_CAEEX|nr:hypothetical protein CEXT_227821 [Caerostris extrusa]